MAQDSDKYLPAGTKVIYDGTGEEECGIVVNCWWDEFLEVWDCHIAFFGLEFPEKNKRSKELPYVLNYSTVTLRVVDETD